MAPMVEDSSLACEPLKWGNVSHAPGHSYYPVPAPSLTMYLLPALSYVLKDFLGLCLRSPV